MSLVPAIERMLQQVIAAPPGPERAAARTELLRLLDAVQYTEDGPAVVYAVQALLDAEQGTNFAAGSAREAAAVFRTISTPTLDTGVAAEDD